MTNIRVRLTRRTKKSVAKYWETVVSIKNFFEKPNRPKTILLIILIGIIFAVAFCFQDFACNQSHILTFSGLLLTIVGIFVSIKVYMEVKKRKTITIEDYNNILIRACLY